MMRGSASTQVSIDYSSAPDCLRKLRLAFALVPLFSLMCDNSPVFEGKPRSHELVRTEIWRHCDPDRCGLVPDVMDPSFDLRRYAAFLLDAPAILVPCKQGAVVLFRTHLRRHLRAAHHDARRGGARGLHVLHRRAAEDLHRDQASRRPAHPLCHRLRGARQGAVLRCREPGRPGRPVLRRARRRRRGGKGRAHGERLWCPRYTDAPSPIWPIA